MKKLEEAIADLKARLLAHSVKPSMLQQLEELEEELEEAKREEEESAQEDSPGGLPEVPPGAMQR